MRNHQQVPESLRAQLATRFANIFIAQYGDGTAYTALNQWQKNKWLELADECIRQMEWARRKCAECPYQDAELDMLELTPAPNDWKPK